MATKSRVVRINEDVYVSLRIKQTQLLVEKGASPDIQKLASLAIDIGLRYLDKHDNSMQTELQNWK